MPALTCRERYAPFRKNFSRVDKVHPFTVKRLQRWGQCDMLQTVSFQRQFINTALNRAWRQRGRKTATVYQFGTYPLLKGLNTPAEARLRDVSKLSGPREALILRERDEVLTPLDFHEPMPGRSPK